MTVGQTEITFREYDKFSTQMQRNFGKKYSDWMKEEKQGISF